MIILISKNLQWNLDKLKELFHNSSDFVIHEFVTLSNTNAFVAYINGLIDKEALNENILHPLIYNLVSPMDIKSTIYISGIEEIDSFQSAIMAITSGQVVLFHEDIEIGYALNLCSYGKRAIVESVNEQVLRGPKEAFVEDILINKTLIRRKIRNSNLVFEDFIFGEQTNTKVSIVYINGIVNPEILAELKARLKKIKIDGILDINYIEEYIDDAPNNFVSTVFNTEKPDVLAGKILEGRIGILCDGSPNAVTLPCLFIEYLMTAEDYYLKPKFGTYLRLIRFTSLFISITLAGFYIALINFHQEMIPTKLLISMAGQREGVPLASFLEAMLMIFFFEILKEAGLRLPKTVGQTVTLVGGLVIGQAAVDAGLVSAIMVIVVSASGITEFVNPMFKQTVVLYRLLIFFLGATFGLYGVICGLMILIYHFTSIKSFGVPYLYPLAPYDKEAMKDVYRRAPLKKLNYRPKYIANENSRKRNK